jgi:hypothetical protein
MKADSVNAHYLLGQVDLELETKTVAECTEEWPPPEKRRPGPLLVGESPLLPD